MPKTKTKSTETLVAFLLDRSGSMMSIRDDTIGAFNAYLDGLQRGGEPIIFSFLQFDSVSVDTLCKNLPVKDVAPLTIETFEPRASTPLIDAAYKTIKAVEEAAEKRQGCKVVVCIQTDGQENCSTSHTWAELNQLIKEKSAAGWQFNFMGAGIDAYAQGARMGISAKNTMSYDSASPEATKAAFSAGAASTMRFASGAAASTAYLASERSAAGDRFDPQGKTKAKPKPETTQSLVDDISL